jgi:hypothetical protein
VGGRPRSASKSAPAKSAIVTIRKRGRFGETPDLTPEEHGPCGDAAEALFREVKRGIPAAKRP